MQPDDSLDQRLAGLARTDLDPYRSERLRARAHHELRSARVASALERDLVEPLLLGSCAALLLARLVWFVVSVINATV